ncbi:MAG: VCBS repeat-containing protein [Gemmatimonadota bacterium]|nr:VCBS repeat-containing protein [Gemmatimonadota bacterium]
MSRTMHRVTWGGAGDEEPVSSGRRPNRRPPSERAFRTILSGLLLIASACDSPSAPSPPAFERVQPDLFAAPGAQPNAWADFDSDGDLDLFVGMRYSDNRLYRNDGGTFVDVAPALGLADPEDTRAAAWGDFDSDGDLDLYVGYPVGANTPNRLYRNDDQIFVDVAPGLGVDLVGTTRQPSWVDYDGDGDLDLFVAMRDQPNRLFRNDGPESFADVTGESGLGDPRRTVGVVWFDYDRDGDLDLHVSNQNGDEDAFYRNEGDGTFTDVAPALGMNHPNRGEEYGSVAPAVADYDNDGDLDLFIATYGPDILWSNNGDGTFTDVTDPATLGVDYHSTTAAWGDVDNDGRPDLVVTSYLSGIAEVEDHLFMNVGGGDDGDGGRGAGNPGLGRFVNALPASLLEHGPSHGVAWADFDRDGDLDLAIANNHETGGTHHLYRNLLPAESGGRSLQVAAVDAGARTMVPGAEVQLADHESGAILGTRLIDTGGGYCSQGAAPAHFGIPAGVERVDVRVTYVVGGRRSVVAEEGVFPPDYMGRWLIVRQGG